MRSVHGWVLAASASATMLCAAPALGQYTDVNSPAPGELTHVEILDGIYSANFVASGGANIVGSGTQTLYDSYTDNTFGIELTRVLDTGNNPLDVGAPYASQSGMADALWADGLVSARAEAVFAGDAQRFGYFSGHGGGLPGALTDSFDVSLTDPNDGFSATGSKSFSLLGANFRWGRERQDGANRMSSNPGDNTNGSDQMVTYAVDFSNATGQWANYNNGRPVWLLFWEDRFTGDFDYNDLVIEISVIPLPAPVFMGLAGLFGVGALRRWMVC